MPEAVVKKLIQLRNRKDSRPAASSAQSQPSEAGLSDESAEQEPSGGASSDAVHSSAAHASASVASGPQDPQQRPDDQDRWLRGDKPSASESWAHTFYRELAIAIEPNTATRLSAVQRAFYQDFPNEAARRNGGDSQASKSSAERTVRALVYCEDVDFLLSTYLHMVMYDRQHDVPPRPPLDVLREASQRINKHWARRDRPEGERPRGRNEIPVLGSPAFMHYQNTVSEVQLKVLEEWGNNAYDSVVPPVPVCPEILEEGFTLGIPQGARVHVHIIGLYHCEDETLGKLLVDNFLHVQADCVEQQARTGRRGKWIGKGLNWLELAGDSGEEWRDTRVHGPWMQLGCWRHSSRSYTLSETNRDGSYNLVVCIWQGLMSFLRKCQHEPFEAHISPDDWMEEEYPGSYEPGAVYAPNDRQHIYGQKARRWQFLYKPVSIRDKRYLRDGRLNAPTPHFLEAENTRYQSWSHWWQDYYHRAFQGNLLTVEGHPERVLMVRKEEIIDGKQWLVRAFQDMGLLRSGQGVQRPLHMPSFWCGHGTGEEQLREELAWHAGHFANPEAHWRAWGDFDLTGALVKHHVCMGAIELGGDGMQVVASFQSYASDSGHSPCVQRYLSDVPELREALAWVYWRWLPRFLQRMTSGELLAIAN